MQITKEEPQAHVILATSNYSFLPWLTDSEPLSCVLSSNLLAVAHLSSRIELQEGFFTTEVIGDFPEADACTYSRD